MIKKIIVPAILLILSLAFSQADCATQPGNTDTVFNKRFIPNVRPGMSYDRLVKLIGVQGARAGADKKGRVPAMHYSWKGGKKSAMDVRVMNGRVLDATMHAPNGHTYRIDGTGKVSDMGD